MLIIILIITILYLFLIGSLIYGFDKVPHIILEDITPKTKFSIVIPFRNEAQYLPALLESILGLNYPKSMFEIILVNDESTDNSVEIITSNTLNNQNLKNISLIDTVRKTKSPKKDAISHAIRFAKYDWIVTTDADCSLPKYWLDVFDNYIQKNNSNLLVAPVSFRGAGSFFERFQLLDVLSLQGTSIGSFGISKPFLCNGANLAYTKAIFNTLSGFEGNTHIASGDDVFLLEKALKYDANKVSYVKHEHLIVTTNPEANFKDLISQRVRWASKTTSYKSAFGKLTGFIVLLMNALLVCLPLLYILQIVNLKPVIYVVFIKILIDFLLLFKTARFFGQERYLSSYIFSSILYPFFSVYVVFISMFTAYKWKGRRHIK